LFLFSNHCERPGRIVAIWKGLQTRGLDKRCTMIPSRMATKEEILLVHSTKFYELIESTKTLSKRDLNKLEGRLRSVEYTNVIKFYFNKERKNILVNS
jgi:acetoin utilization deacetylase AcuC-like enzyme